MKIPEKNIILDSKLDDNFQENYYTIKDTENYLGRSIWWYIKHIPIDFINIFLPLPVYCPGTSIFWLIFRYQSFSLRNT